jgi:putative DNA primase/helicase
MSLDARIMRRLELIERARQADILTAAQRFGALKRVGVSEYVGPCPVCGGKDRFSVNIKKRVWNCRGCGKGGDAIGLPQHAGGATFNEAVAALSGETRASFKPPPRKRGPDDKDDDVRRRRDTARWLWAQRKPLAGSIAETYLRKARGYGGPLPATLRFLRPFKDYPPSLIAAFAIPEEAEPGVLRAPLDVDAVQLIALKADGSDKADVEIQKRTIGSHKGLPIVVAPPNDLLAISVHEGVEDALSAHEATGLGAWASGGASLLPDLADAIPAYVECVTVVAHKDEAGRIGARELGRRVAARGFKVLLHGGA